MHLHFGDFSFDISSRQLRQGDVDRHLSPKAFELLRLLLEHRPRAVSKAELHERLWPGTFVSDATVTSLVAELRAARGERAGRGRFVRTVHRFGYAFKGTVSEQAPTPSHDARAQCWIVWDWGQVPLTEGSHLVGRDEGVAVWLESPTVSRQHARIRVVGEQASVEDLGSKNGTYLRGERLMTAASLADGDEVRVGSVTLRFRRVAQRISTETQQSS
jgi:DNA-binding winged helix-turn-helix (wHTH) protein